MAFATFASNFRKTGPGSSFRGSDFDSRNNKERKELSSGRPVTRVLGFRTRRSINLRLVQERLFASGHREITWQYVVLRNTCTICANSASPLLRKENNVYSKFQGCSRAWRKHQKNVSLLECLVEREKGAGYLSSSGWIKLVNHDEPVAEALASCSIIAARCSIHTLMKPYRVENCIAASLNAIRTTWIISSCIIND